MNGEIKTPPTNKKYRDGYDQINWKKSEPKNQTKKECIEIVGITTAEVR